MSTTTRRLLNFSSAYWVVAFAFFVAMMLITTPTPIYELWQLRDNFSTIGSTVVFSMNATGVLVTLFLAAHLSDKLGRRTTMIISLVVLILACLVFASDPAFVGILFGRLLSGIGVGMVTATAPTYLTELRLKANPEANPQQGGAFVAVITLGGFAFGSLMTALLDFVVSSPTRTPFIILGIVFVAFIIMLIFIPETGTPELRAQPYHLQRISIPPHARSGFFAAATGAFSSYAVIGFFGALTPALVANVVKITPLHESELGGSIAFSIYIAAAAGQFVFRKARGSTQITMAAILMCSGLVCLGISAIAPTLVILILGGILAGAGAGLIFVVSVAFAASIVPYKQRGETISAIYFAAYLGMPLPIIGAGIGLTTLGPLITVPAFGLLILILVLWCCRRMLRTTKDFQLMAHQD